MWTWLQVERECITVRVGLREVSSSPSVLSTRRSQGLFYQVSRGERSQLMLMHESLSSPDGIKGEEADCNPQSRSLGSPGRRKSHQVGMGLPSKCKQWALGKQLNLVCLFLGWSLPRHSQRDFSLLDYHHIPCLPVSPLGHCLGLALLSSSVIPFLAGSLGPLIVSTILQFHKW